MTDHSGTHIMSRTSEEKDLGIFITDNLKSSVQYVPKLQPEHAPYSVWSEETSNALTVKTLARSQEWMILLFAH